MRTRRISNNHYIVKSFDYSGNSKKHYDFKATIKMNPRDSMVAATISQLPEDENQLKYVLEQFLNFLEFRVGGKILLTLPAGFKNELLPPKTSIANAKYIDAETLSQVMQELAHKDYVEDHLENMSKGSEHYKLLQRPEDYEGMHEALFNFKQKNASFVTTEKIKAGIYSSNAEKQKITNEFVKHFAIYDLHRKEFIACLETFTHGDMVYISDLIVKESERTHGFAQAIMVSAFRNMNEKIKGIWFITGSDGNSEMGKHLYDVLLKAKNIDAELQTRLGIRPWFIPPQKLLLAAANRSTALPNNSLDNESSLSTLSKFGLFTALAITAGAVVYYCNTPKTLKH